MLVSIPMVILLFVQSSPRWVGWLLAGVFGVPILVVICLSVPFHTLVVCKLVLAEEVVIASLLVSFCTWV